MAHLKSYWKAHAWLVLVIGVGSDTNKWNISMSNLFVYTSDTVNPFVYGHTNKQFRKEYFDLNFSSQMTFDY